MHFFVCAIVLLNIWNAFAQTSEPLCATVNCQASSEACRVVRRCDAVGACSLQAVCLPTGDSDYFSGGCNLAEPLLKPDSSNDSRSGYNLESCWGTNPCPDNFYCSTALQDVASRCCRSNPTPTNAKGTCPALTDEDSFFCVDQCLTDADCGFYGQKCCQNSNTCTKKTCKSPEPCSVVDCAPGEICVVNNYVGQCIPPPPLQPPAPQTSGTSTLQTLCKNPNQCNAATEVCRVVENCLPGSPSCTYEEACLPSRVSQLNDGGCEPGSALLVRSARGYGLRVCGPRLECGQGAFCSTRLMDVSSRCCIASADATPKPGTCPVDLTWGDAFFCMDECVNDADCNWDDKCCPKSSQCSKKICKRPAANNLNSCQTTNCPRGQECVMQNGRTACVPVPPPLPLDVQLATGSDTNTNTRPNTNTNTISLTCPFPYGPYNNGECSEQNMCGHGNGWACPQGLMCCATRDCGNICRVPVSPSQLMSRLRRWW